MTSTDPRAIATTSGRTVNDFALDDRYALDSGPVLLTGVQAIARALIQQRARDRAAGRHTATFVSGYQGSPLGTIDTLLGSIPRLREDHEILLQPGVNEELGATAVWGTQRTLPGDERSVDGIVGVWYGKGPGLDRASDAIRHANMYGTDPRGGVVALVGDDPAAKSSTLPFASDATLAALNMPFFTPRNGEEVILHILAAVELSRVSGCWVGVKIVSDVGDGLWTVGRSFADHEFVVPQITWEGHPWTYRQRTVSTPGESVQVEADFYGPRWAMVQAFVAANDLDEVFHTTGPARVGLIGSGTAFDAAIQTLEVLGLERASLAERGVRLMRIAAPYPIDPQRVESFASGLERLLVVEEKGDFLESQVKSILYALENRPTVLGKRDEHGKPLVPARGELVVEKLQGPLWRFLDPVIEVERPKTASLGLSLLPVQRTPYFCSGCPHNKSTVVPEGSIAAGGIGCHTLASISARDDAAIAGWTQMGGEGAQWIGQAPFSSVDHIFQNLGDGTLFHSGQLALQAAIAAGVNITYKILYNSAVAMTGAQDPQGGLAVPDLTRKLLGEGVRRVIVCADEPERYRGVKMPKGVVVWPRERIDEAQLELRKETGVTVMIYDEQCAANARRLRKRGKLEARPTRVVINQDVCEGCGDCGVKSNCLSVQPVETELGRKTVIDQTSCNTDYTCLQGDCPSFVTVGLPEDGRRAKRLKPAKVQRPKGQVVNPPAVPDFSVGLVETDVFMAGIGGTGIVTVNQVLATAALRAGYQVDGLDQTGLSQKAGPVVSHLRLAVGEGKPSNRIGRGSADLFLAFDLLVGADARYGSYSASDRTAVVASTSRTPTGDMVADPSVAYPEDDVLLGRLRERSHSIHHIDALQIARDLFGSTASANFLLVGMAHQAGELPIPAEHIEEAIRMNGVAVAVNVAAFRWGRALVVDPDCVPVRAARVARRHSDRVRARIEQSGVAGETRRIMEERAPRLEAYQGAGLALEYVDEVTKAWAAEREAGERTEFSAAVARYLFKLLAYKDEYEVARLLTDPTFLQDAQDQVPGGTQLTYNLHPPLLRALGMKRKIALGPWARPLLVVLAKAKVLRGTWLDPFGRSSMRKLERQLARDYRERIVRLSADLQGDAYERAVEIAELPDVIRGYEEIKLRNVATYQASLDRLDERASLVR